MDKNYEPVFVRNDDKKIIELNPDGILNKMSVVLDNNFYHIVDVKKTGIKVTPVSSDEETFFTIYDLIFEFDNVAFKELDSNLMEVVSFSETYNELTMSLYSTDGRGTQEFMSAISFDLLRYDIPKH
jgi:hypothetical protein